jgi:hypothetical protein
MIVIWRDITIPLVTTTNNKTTLHIKRNSGFFSCCSVKLSSIIDFYNKREKLPDNVDSTRQFKWYKRKTDKNITYTYFKAPLNTPISYNGKIKYHHKDQYKIYSKINLESITPVVQKYFTPSDQVINIKNAIKEKYNIIPEETCVLFYRGNDKNIEAKTCSYKDVILQGRKIQLENPAVRFMIQSDETEFIETMKKEFTNSFVCEDEIRHIKKRMTTVDKTNSDNYDFSIKFLAITLIMAENRYLVCCSGNCSIWIIFYREHTRNLYQYLSGTWYYS